MLTPLDLENKRFSKKINGYSVDEVDDFLDQVTLEFSKLYKENNEYKAQVEQSKKDLEHYKNVEEAMQKALIMAQSTADDIKDMAQKQADQIIRDAQSEARRSVDDLSQQEIEISKKIDMMKQQYKVFKTKMENQLISQLDLLKDDKDDNEF